MYQKRGGGQSASSNGKGFKNTRDIVGLTNHQHFGLAGMAERAEAINGGIEIKTRPGEGTAIRVSIPIARQEQN